MITFIKACIGSNTSASRQCDWLKQFGLMFGKLCSRCQGNAAIFSVIAPSRKPLTTNQTYPLPKEWRERAPSRAQSPQTGMVCHASQKPEWIWAGRYLNSPIGSWERHLTGNAEVRCPLSRVPLLASCLDSPASNPVYMATHMMHNLIAIQRL